MPADSSGQTETDASEATWQARLSHIVETMQAISRHSDAQALVAEYRHRMRGVIHMDRMLSLTRRGMSDPQFLVARDTWRQDEPNPWTQRERLPELSGGLLGDLLYGRDERIVFDDLHVSAGDPGAAYLDGMRSMVAVPVFDGGEALNRVVFLKREPNGFDPENLPQLVWTTNLMGRLTHNLMLSAQLRQAHDQLKLAHDQLDDEMKVIAEIQRSLLPVTLPHVPTLELGASYEPAARAGGDYYDVFQRPDGRWVIVIADVSGHGSPAAVLMAITHSLTHSHPSPDASAAQMLSYVNRHLAARYTADNGRFVTAFIGLYDPATHELVYASAGHHPARLRGCDGDVRKLDAAQGLPLGVFPHFEFRQSSVHLRPGDRVLLYTDGITEAMDPAARFFGEARLDESLQSCELGAQGIVDHVMQNVATFAAGRPADDDRTLLALRVVG